MVDDIDILGNFASSAHHILKWTTVLNTQQIEYRSTSKDFSRAYFDGIRHMLQQVNWEMVLDGEVEECWAAFKHILQNAIDQFVPDKLSYCGSYKKARWITHRAVKFVRRKHNLFRRYRDVKNPKYIEAAREAKVEIRRAKRRFEKKLAENIKSDNKSFFAYARSRNNTKVFIGPISNESGTLDTDPQTVAEELNKYFSSVFTKEDVQHIPDLANSIMKLTSNLSDIVIDEELVRQKLQKLRSDKATGANDISPKLLVEIKDEVCTPLTVIFQNLLATGQVPSDWKQADVTPIHKKRSRSEPSNYRPISLTNQICKLFETIVRDAIVEHLERNELINDTHHGFGRGRSCLTNLLIFR